MRQSSPRTPAAEKTRLSYCASAPPLNTFGGGRAGGIGCAMHVEYRALGAERGHVGRVLVAHEDFDPRIGGFHHHLFGDETCLCDCGGREHGGGSDNAERNRVHFHVPPSIVQSLPTRRSRRSVRQAKLMSIHNSYAAHSTPSELAPFQWIEMHSVPASQAG